MGGGTISPAHKKIPYFFRICFEILSTVLIPESTLFGIVSQPKDLPDSGALP